MKKLRDVGVIVTCTLKSSSQCVAALQNQLIEF